MVRESFPSSRRTSIESEERPDPQARHRTDVLRVALAQTAPKLGDVAFNLGSHVRWIDEARQAKADLVIFPELSLTGYFLKDLVPEVAVRLDSLEVKQLAEMSKGIDILVGAVIESEDFRFYNAALYFSNGRLHFVHRKVYLPTYGLFDEARYLAKGDRIRAFMAPFATPSGKRERRAGILICEDMWHPSAAAILARDGVDIFLCTSASPGRGVGEGSSLGTANSYAAITRTYAQLFTAYVIYCNRVGYEDGVAFWGGSRVLGPDGSLLCDPAGRDETMLVAELSPKAVRRARIANPMLRDERHDVNDAEHERLRTRRPSD